GAAERVAVHRRAVEPRHRVGGGDVLGEHAAEGGGHRRRRAAQRTGALEHGGPGIVDLDQLLRQGQAVWLIHCDTGYVKRPVTVGAVLAGGASRRMGAPKALVQLASRPLVWRVVSTVGSAGLDPVVVAKPDSPLPRLDCRVLSEPTEPQHPLTGIIAALGASAGRPVVAIACDMPLVPARLISWLAQLEEEVAVCEADGRLQPLLGRYSPSACDQL